METIIGQKTEWPHVGIWPYIAVVKTPVVKKCQYHYQT